MVEFGEWRLWSNDETLMDPEAFVSRQFRRAAREVNTILVSFREHREMPIFLRQLAAILQAFPPDDPPPPGVLAWLPGDGSPSPGGLCPLITNSRMSTPRTLKRGGPKCGNLERHQGLSRHVPAVSGSMSRAGFENPHP